MQNSCQGSWAPEPPTQRNDSAVQRWAWGLMSHEPREWGVEFPGLPEARVKSLDCSILFLPSPWPLLGELPLSSLPCLYWRPALPTNRLRRWSFSVTCMAGWKGKMALWWRQRGVMTNALNRLVSGHAWSTLANGWACARSSTVCNCTHTVLCSQAWVQKFPLRSLPWCWLTFSVTCPL